MIRYFGEQWLRYINNEGYHGSPELFSDILFQFLKIEEIKDCRVGSL